MSADTDPGEIDLSLPTCESCVSWTGEECRANPPVPILIQGQVVTVFPRTKGTSWCLSHESIDDQFTPENSPENSPEGHANV